MSRALNTYRRYLKRTWTRGTPEFTGVSRGRHRRLQLQRIAAHFHLQYIAPKGDGHETHYGRQRQNYVTL